VADGAHAPSDVRALDDADLVLAADGGAAWLAEAGVSPHWLIGDLDSADPDLVARLTASGVAVERYPADKDASDLELSLQAALRAGADDIVILGALGGVVDHLLANVLLLETGRTAVPGVRLTYGGTTVRLLHGPGRLDLGAPVGSRVSLLPLGTADGVATRGLRWPLTDEPLAAGSSRGLANRIDTAPAEVAIRSGQLLVVTMTEEGQS